MGSSTNSIAFRYGFQDVRQWRIIVADVGRAQDDDVTFVVMKVKTGPASG